MVPISITEPLTGTPFGPFIRVQASTDLIGPIPVTWQWRLRVLEAPPGETTIYEYLINTNGLRTLDTLLQPNTSTPVTQPVVDKRTQQGQPVVFKVILENEGSVIEEAQTSPNWDWLSGAAWAQLGTHQLVTDNRFTAQDHEDLVVTKMAAGFGIGGGWSDALGDLLGAVGRRIFNDVLIAPDRSGEGSLVPPAPGLFGVPFGIQWQLISKPDGFGIDEGVPDRTEIDFMQLSYMYDSDIGLVPRDSRYVRDLKGRWVWGLEWPDSLDYFIMPGVTVRFWWMVINPSLP